MHAQAPPQCKAHHGAAAARVRAGARAAAADAVGVPLGVRCRTQRGAEGWALCLKSQTKQRRRARKQRAASTARTSAAARASAFGTAASARGSSLLPQTRAASRRWPACRAPPATRTRPCVHLLHTARRLRLRALMLRRMTAATSLARVPRRACARVVTRPERERFCPLQRVADGAAPAASGGAGVNGAGGQAAAHGVRAAQFRLCAHQRSQRRCPAALAFQPRARRGGVPVMLHIMQVRMWLLSCSGAARDRHAAGRCTREKDGHRARAAGVPADACRCATTELSSTARRVCCCRSTCATPEVFNSACLHASVVVHLAAAPRPAGDAGGSVPYHRRQRCRSLQARRRLVVVQHSHPLSLAQLPCLVRACAELRARMPEARA